MLVLIQAVAQFTKTLVCSQGVDTVVFTARNICYALIDVIAATAVWLQSVASSAAALIAARVVSAEVTAAGLPTDTLISIYTGLPVPVQVVAVVAGAQWAVGGVLAVMRATSIVLLTAVDDLHLDAVALFAVSTKLKARMTHAAEGAQHVDTSMGTLGVA